MVRRDPIAQSARSARDLSLAIGLGWTVTAASFGLALLSAMPNRALAYEGYVVLDPSRGPSERSPQAPRRQVARAHTNEAKNQPAKPEPPKPPTGPLTISVSIGSQHVTVYDDVMPIGTSAISTGMAGHPTPLGVFTVIQKDRYHHSNIYSNAPMPFMQRITWSGVALHAGVVPGYPASHGCIRLPESFAVRLWNMTHGGERVIVARNDVVPHQIMHSLLVALATPRPDPEPQATPEPATPAPAVAPKAPEVKQPEVSPADTNPVEGAAAGTNQSKPKAADAKPAAAATEEAVKTDPPSGAAETNLASGTDVATIAPATPAPSAQGERLALATSPDKAADVSPAMSPFGPNDRVPVPQDRPAKAVSHPGPISMFISRKSGKLYVRKGYEPMFDMPITIADKDVPLGTHVFTAGLAPDGVGLRWVAMSVAAPDQSPEPQPRGRRGAREVKPAAPPEPVARSASEALNRIELPDNVLDRVVPLITPGASLLISDLNLSGETGKGTDFIVTMR